MKKIRRVRLVFAAVLAVVLFFMQGYSSAHTAEPENQNHAGSGSAGPAYLNEIYVMPGHSAESLYVANNDLYLLKQEPMTEAYGAFSMIPIVMSHADGRGAMDAGSVGLSSGDALPADASSALDRADEEHEHLQGIKVAMNMDFREEADEPAAPGSGVDSSQESEDIADPLEPINRVFFTINDKFYFWALKPLATAYGFFVPEWGRTRVRNVFDNIQAPIRLINALLQLKMHKFGAEFAKFVLNSTVGIAGLFDIASRHPELKTSEEDLGQTFGFYGFGEGFYFVLPFLGPSSLRDAAGKVGDSFLDPIGYITPLRDAVAVRSLDQVNDTSFNIGRYEDIKESALDPYISIRDIYKQYRRNKILE